MIPFLMPIIGAVISTATGWFKHKQKMRERRQLGELEWARYMAQASGKSWKDEYLTLLWTLPILLAMFGYTAPLENLLNILKQIPEWYTYLLLVITLASFGLSANGRWKEFKSREEFTRKRIEKADKHSHGINFEDETDAG